MKIFSEPFIQHLRMRGRRCIAFLLCFLLAAALLPAFSAGAEETDGTAEEGKIVRVGWYDSSFNHMDKYKRRSGYAYEYQMKIAAYTGWRYEYVTGSWPTLLEMLKHGEIDLMSDVSKTDERKTQMLFSNLPMGSEEYYLFISQDNRSIRPSDSKTLKGKKIGVNAGSFQRGEFITWATEEEHLTVAEDPAQASAEDVLLIDLDCPEDESLRMLQTGEMDGYVTVDSFETDMVAEPGLPVPAFLIGSSDIFFAVSNSREDLIKELNGAMLQIRKENNHFNHELMEKHLVAAGANAILSDTEKDWLVRHGTIRVGYQDNYLAFCAKDPETGELTGGLRDYLEYAADCIVNDHLDFRAFAYPTAGEAIQALKNGEVDCVFPANLSAGDGEREHLFITPALMQSDIFAVVRQDDRRIFSERTYIVVAVNDGNPNYISTLNDFYPQWQRVVYPTTADCLKAVSQGVADCVLISSYRYNNIARLCEQLNLAAVSTPVRLDYCFAVSASRPELYSIMTKVSHLVPESTVNTFMTRYVAEDARSTLWDFVEGNRLTVFLTIGIVLLVILALLIRSQREHRKAARLISATEIDHLTGLFNRGYFLQYAERIHRERPGTAMDAIVLNIERFHSVNATNGREFGDRVLRTLGNEIRIVAKENDGIAGRFEADRFDIYCRPVGQYPELYNRLQEKLDNLAPAGGIRLRMGVMPWEEKADVVQMFDRARTACAMTRGSISEHLVIFDGKMQERENYEQRLLNELHRALTSYEFEVYYQPQFDIRFNPPKLVSAEALVRWNHPDLGLIPPNDFVPLFEQHGKIGEVDHYVWSEAARQIARWRDLYGVVIPVSVNLSRVDVFNPSLETSLDRLMAYNGLAQDMLKLEVTESAYTGDADRVIRVVERLRAKGYVVEMDDFGTGYSSLNMLSAMPVDVLKMDRGFIRRIGESEKDTQLVGLILGISRSLNIPVVAEGVETEEQVQLLRELGCSLVQGYYFGRPVPVTRFEDEFIRNMPDGGAAPEQ